MTNPLNNLIGGAVAGAVAGDDKPKKKSVGAAFAKSVAKSVALAPVSYAKNLGSSLTQAALMSIPGYYIAKTVTTKIKRHYESVKDKAEAIEREIEKKTRDQDKAAAREASEAKKLAQEIEKEEKEKVKLSEKEQKAKDKAALKAHKAQEKINKTQHKALIKAQKVQEAANKKKAREDQKAFNKAWREAEKEERDRAKANGQKPPKARKPPKLPPPAPLPPIPEPAKLPEPPIGAPKKKSDPGAATRAYKKRFEKIAVLEQKIADIQHEVLGLTTIIKNLTEQGIKSTQENIRISGEIAKVVESVADEKKRNQIAALQSKETALETSRQDNMLDTLKVVNSVKEEEEKGLLSSIVTGAIAGRVTIAVSAAAGAITAALPALVGAVVAASPAVIAIGASVLTLYGIVKAITPDDTTGMNMLEKGYSDALKSLNPDSWREDRLQELTDLDADIAARQARFDADLAYMQKNYKPGSIKQRLAAGVLALDQGVLNDAKKKRETIQRELGMFKIKTGSGLVYDGTIELSDEDKEALARLMYAEAGGESEAGKAAVAYSVLNRVMISQKDGTKQFGQKQNTVQGVINAPGQYDAVMYASQKARGKDPDARDKAFVPDWRDIPVLPDNDRASYMAIIEKMISGQLPDPTGGATFYLNRSTGKDFANAEASYVTKIGNHTFYNAAAVNKKYEGSIFPTDYDTKKLGPEPTISRPEYERTIDSPPSAGPDIVVLPVPESQAENKPTPSKNTKGPEDNTHVSSPYNSDVTFNQETRANAYG